MLAATIANANRDPKQRRKAYRPGDFFYLPHLDPEAPATAADHAASLRAALLMMCARSGVKIIRKQRTKGGKADGR